MHHAPLVDEGEHHVRMLRSASPSASWRPPPHSRPSLSRPLDPNASPPLAVFHCHCKREEPQQAAAAWIWS